MNIVLWVIQVMVALAFLMAGGMKITQPLDRLEKNMSWVTGTPAWIVRTVGILEVLGALGLLLPMLTHIWPWLTVAAAVGLVLTMIAAFFVHIARKEYNGRLAVPLVLLVLALLIAYGRVAIVHF